MVRNMVVVAGIASALLAGAGAQAAQHAQNPCAAKNPRAAKPAQPAAREAGKDGAAAPRAVAQPRQPQIDSAVSVTRDRDLYIYDRAGRIIQAP